MKKLAGITVFLLLLYVILLFAAPGALRGKTTTISASALACTV